ncbi:MAG: Hsp33 family molecular chaperone HslO [Pseudomonadales bacterium]
MSSKDQLQRFMFDQLGVRGQLVKLNDSFLEATVNHDYPAAVKQVLGEFMAAASLLSTTIKFEGSLTLQAQGDGEVSLIMAECRHDQEVRGIVRWEGEDDPKSADFLTLLGNGQMAVTITPDKGQRYQGIIALEKDTLATCLEDYFEKSEQLKTRVWLTSKTDVCSAGLLIQVLPDSQGSVEDDDGWSRVCQLSDTLRNEELQLLDNEEILLRLFHEEEVRVFPPTDIKFKCTCSAYRTLEAMVSMGKEEIVEVFSEQPQITVRCEFCNTGYEVTQDDIKQHLLDTDDSASPPTLH